VARASALQDGVDFFALRSVVVDHEKADIGDVLRRGRQVGCGNGLQTDPRSRIREINMGSTPHRVGALAHIAPGRAPRSVR
jgi:hypothetical protein